MSNKIGRKTEDLQILWKRKKGLNSKLLTYGISNKNKGYDVKR